MQETICWYCDRAGFQCQACLAPPKKATYVKSIKMIYGKKKRFYLTYLVMACPYFKGQLPKMHKKRTLVTANNSVQTLEVSQNI